MKELNIHTIIDGYNAMVAGWVLLLSTIFGTHWYLFMALLLFNILDWLTGWYKARKLKQVSSAIGLRGLVKKIFYWVLIAVSFVSAAVFTKLGEDVLLMDLSCCEMLGWFCLASLLVNEVRSIVENLIEMGVPVPEAVASGLKVAETMVEKETVSINRKV